MRSRGSDYHLRRRARLSVWLFAVVMLLLGLLTGLQSVEGDASDSAFLVASKRVIERGNYYKQKWLLAGQPQRLNTESQVMAFSPHGWVLPTGREGKVDCHFWLELLYPEERVFKSRPVEVNNVSQGEAHYRCDYDYGDNRHLVIDLNNKRFSAKVVFVAE